MSEIAGRLAAQAGAYFLQDPLGGPGVLIGGVTGVAPARIVGSAEEVWSESELLLKVKEPIESEYPLMHPDLTLFTYLHLAPDRPLTEALMSSGATGLAYETVETPDGRLPLLSPMSEIAGQLAARRARTSCRIRSAAREC
ncbi:MAG: hypothetical protein ACXWHH_11385 [Solirubrobacterales bacterium]